ncbi:MAG: hypothetical protein U0903_12155 [Planctomycetales bacterium]
MRTLVARLLPDGIKPKLDSESGRLWLQNHVIHYALGKETLEIPLSQLRIFGEYTNQDGPFGEDYFYVFITGPDSWFEASVSAAGRDEFLSNLQTELQTVFPHSTLVGSTDFASKILWPTDLQGQPLFDFAKVPMEGLLGKLLWHIGVSSVQMSFSRCVDQKLRE